jgi:2-C-methyl-D-erythritol 2,4-cyclodiphosphate synthase
VGENFYKEQRLKLKFRIGIGYDAHPLVQNRPLILGGVMIDHFKGLWGHSDADVLTHAICDALLGAAGLGDLGLFFPDKDPQWKGVKSLTLLEKCFEKICQLNWEIQNIDSIIICQNPKLAPYFPEMIENLSKILQLPKNGIQVKAKTTEKLGFEGREEGIAAQAICLIGKL